jgi:hypothetical protein
MQFLAFILAFLFIVQVLAGSKEGSVIDFNEALTIGAVATVERLMSVPWTRILHIMSAGFNTGTCKM